jgi:hypothetical protein
MGMLAIAGTASAQSLEDQVKWGRLAVLTTCDDRTEHMHAHGFSHDGTNTLIAYFRKGEQEMADLTRQRYAEVCARKDSITSPQQLADVLRPIFRQFDSLRRAQVDGIATVLSADDRVAWATFRDDTRNEATGSGEDVINMILGGERSVDFVLARTCQAADLSDTMTNTTVITSRGQP